MSPLTIGLIALAAAGQGPAAGEGPDHSTRCGSYCTYVGLKALGRGPATFADFEREVGPPGKDGYSMLQLEAGARRFGVETIGVEADVAQLAGFARPFACVASTGSHFVLVQDYDPELGIVHLIDPPRLVKLPLDTFRTACTNRMLLLGTSPIVLPADQGRRAAGPGVAAGVVGGLAGLCLLGFAARRLVRSRNRLRAASAVVAILAAMPALSGCGPGGSPRLASARPAVIGGSPALRVEERQIDLGEVLVRSQDETVEAKTALWNDGPSSLRIVELRRSCACTTAVVEPTVIPPGGRSELRARIRVGNKSGPDQSVLTVVCNDPTVPDAAIVIRWKARTQLFIESGSLHFGRLELGAKATLRRDLMSRGLELCADCRFVASGNHSAIESAVRVDDALRHGGRGHDGDEVAGAESPPRSVGSLEVSIEPGDDPGDYRQGVELTLSCGATTRSTLFVPVEWTIRPSVEVVPSRLWLGTCRPGEVVVREVLVRSGEGQPFRVTGVTCETPSALRSSKFGDAEQPLQVVTLSLCPQGAAGPGRLALEMTLAGRVPARAPLSVSYLIEPGAAVSAGGQRP